ncbi:unnamed protein product [Nezara viridula]|uniref:Uncharacterized protein n=1 Tax=Nezara viridula TaxID=85310 RepID=A0A9P0H8V6_NEZVI|nr:unnamed protein product [Nezara viridula]
MAGFATAHPPIRTLGYFTLILHDALSPFGSVEYFPTSQMSFNGDTGVAKRQRTDLDGVQQRDHTDGYNKNYEPRRKR